MATESPMRMIETTAAREWPSSKEGGAFGTPLNSLAAEELGLLMKRHNLPENQADMILNRSGSAPPSIEGSFAAMRNLLAQQNTQMDYDVENISSAIENCEFEEKMRSDPAYLAYYCSNIKINPRLPPPLISRENQRLVRHINAFGTNRKLNSLDGSGDGSLQAPQYTLSTHKEEPEDNRLPQDGSDNQSEEASMSGQNASLSARHKSLVDLIQEDFPRTPSPVYSLSRSSIHATEESADHDANVTSLDISSLSISKEPEHSPTPVKIGEESSSHVANDTGLVSNDGPQSTFIQSSSPLEVMENTPALHRETSRGKDLALKDDASTVGSFGLDISKMDSRVKASGEKSYRNKREDREPYGRSVPPRHSNVQRGVYSQDQGGQGHVIYQGVNHPHNDSSNLPYSQSALPIEGHSAMHYSGIASPLYATAATYMTSGSPLYPNFQPFSPPYSMGYLSSTLIPPYMAGYPTHAAATNMPIDANPGPSVGSQATTVPTGESIPHSGGFQNMNSFYGQQGFVVQPPYVDPLHMQYGHNLYGDMYGPSIQSGYRSGVGSHEASFVSHRNPANASYFIGQKTQPPTNECIPNPDPTKVGMSIGRYYGNPSMGIVTQFPASLASPALPSSPAIGTSNFGRRSEIWSPQSPNRSFGGYPGWQGQRGAINIENSKRHSILEELKSGNARRFEISDIVGHVVDFSADQHGSRFIQQKLESSDGEEKKIVFKEILPHAPRLMTDVFGNYVIQKLFEHGSPEQRAELADQLVGQILNLSLQMYGCRVIQKALEVIELDQKIRLVSELDGHVMRCVRDQNGNHVIQKCIECVPADKIEFIISEFHGQVATLSTHPYGCRVIQRILEHCTDEQLSRCIVDEILESAFVLAQDQYGNYVTQHVLERGKAQERRQIVSKLAGKVVQMSQHKYASNVVEKCFLFGDASEQESMINEILGQSEENDHLLVMMKDQYANYVVQKILETCGERHRATLLSHIRVHLNSLKKYTYGKHIVARYEQLFGEAGQASET